MFSPTLKRSAATLGVVVGLLAAAVPASAAVITDYDRNGFSTPTLGSPAKTVSMLDYEGSPVVTYSLDDRSPGGRQGVEARIGGKMHLEDISLGVLSGKGAPTVDH